jgi:2',3'-cyclic-nucleotide 2'-phosphodiesterase/3'-nucleotidase
LHTTDIHGHILPVSDYDGTPDLGGFARCATQIRRWRRKNPNTILIDIGDVYQGTEVGFRSKGQLMIDLFNHLRYDAWVIGNHEFDWGINAFRAALHASKMPVLAANATIGGTRTGDFDNRKDPFTRLRPYFIKEIGGIRIAIVGITTPGMPYWFRPEYLGGLGFDYPVEAVRRSIQAAKSEGAHAIVLAGHMGLKLKTGGDDFANNVMSLTSEFPDAAVFLAGHTHQNVPSRLTNGVLLTQSNHYGIHAGRVDLVFDRESKRLLQRHARCELMDAQIRLDHIVMSRAKAQLAEADAALATPVGELAESLSAIIESLGERGVKVNAALHGLFDETAEMPAGMKTIEDVWKIIPYENYLVTAELTAGDLTAVMEETYTTRERRSLLGMIVRTTGEGIARRVAAVTTGDGIPLDSSRRYTVAFNTFDSRSAGHRFMRLRALLDHGETRCHSHDVQTRDAVIEYFQRHKVVRRLRPDGMPVVA